MARGARVLELGAGTGQHAAYILSQRPDLFWHCTDLPVALPGIAQWLADVETCGARYRISELDAQRQEQWPSPASVDWVFMANTLHYVSQTCARAMLACAAQSLVAGGRVAIYGPFNEQGRYTSEGNRALDEWLHARDPQSGIKDLEWLVDESAGLALEAFCVQRLPANNLGVVMTKMGKQS